jgi:hypothetical protein
MCNNKVSRKSYHWKRWNADIIDLTCEFVQVAFIIITLIIIAKDSKLKIEIKEKTG